MNSIPIMCFPHAGAGRLYYNQWQYAFNGTVDLRIVRYPLREQRAETPMPASVGALAEDIFEEFEETFRGPYAIWGHSMGSVIGYEVAKLCQQRLGNPPMTFFSSGAAAPCRVKFTRVKDLDDPEGFRSVLRHYGGSAVEHARDPDFLRYFAPAIKADLRLLGSYQDTAGERLRCPVVVMLGRDDTVTADQWERYSEHPLDVHEYDGGHFFLDDHRASMASLMESKVQLAWQLGGARTVDDWSADVPGAPAPRDVRVATGNEQERDMENALAAEVVEWLLTQSGGPGGVRSTTTLLGLRWEVLPGVWQPNPGTGLFTSWLPLADGVRFLEIGCAAGVTCVVAARSGCSRVVGLDIVPAATENTRRNAARHGVAGQVEAYTSDLFAELESDDLFDVVGSNPPLVRAPDSHQNSTEIEQAVFDPGFALHRRFFQEIQPHLAEGGRIYMLTSEMLGDPDALSKLAADAGFTGRVYRREEIRIPVAAMGSPPAAVAAAGEHGLIQVDFTMLEFQRC